MTGQHSGRLKAYSQGDGASFVPSKPFDAGETVTVRGRLTVAGKAQTFAYHFVVATPDNLRYVAPRTRPGRPRRGAALPLAPGTGTAVARDHGALAPDRAGRPVLRALLRPGPERADDLRRSRQRGLVRPGARRRCGDQPAGAAARRQARADLVAGLHPAAGFRRGRRGDPQQRLPARRARPRGQRLQSRPARLPHHAPGHRRADGVRPDRLQPLRRRRPSQRRGHRRDLPGNRPAHRARPARVAQPRPRPARATPTAPRRPPAPNGRSTTSTSTRSTSSPRAGR